MKKLHSLFVTVMLLVVSLFLIPGCDNLEEPPASRTEILSDGWKIQSGDKLEGITGEAISQGNFQSEDWYDAVVPGTVLGSLASGGVIEDPYFGINMKKIDPGQFRQPWW